LGFRVSGELDQHRAGAQCARAPGLGSLGEGPPDPLCLFGEGLGFSEVVMAAVGNCRWEAPRASGFACRLCLLLVASTQAMARISSMASALAGPEGNVDVAQLKETLSTSMPTVASSPGFIGLSRFVVNVGAEKAGFVKYLKAFVGARGQNR